MILFFPFYLFWKLLPLTEIQINTNISQILLMPITQETGRWKFLGNKTGIKTYFRTLCRRLINASMISSQQGKHDFFFSLLCNVKEIQSTAPIFAIENMNSLRKLVQTGSDLIKLDQIGFLP